MTTSFLPEMRMHAQQLRKAIRHYNFLWPTTKQTFCKPSSQNLRSTHHLRSMFHLAAHSPLQIMDNEGTPTCDLPDDVTVVGAEPDGGRRLPGSRALQYQAGAVGYAARALNPDLRTAITTSPQIMFAWESALPINCATGVAAWACRTHPRAIRH